MPTSDASRPIRRCVCGDTTFAELWARGVRTMGEAERLGCGVRCGLCRSYLARMFETGETAFGVEPKP